MAGHFTKCCIALNTHKCRKGFIATRGRQGRFSIIILHHDRLIGVDIEHSFVCIAHFPHKHHADKHGVADFIINLYGVDVHIADAQRHLATVAEGVNPEEAYFVECAFVFAEKYYHTALVGLLRKEAE